MEIEIREIPLWDGKDRNSQKSKADSKGLAMKKENPSFARKEICGSSPRREDVAFHPRENNGEASQLITGISSTICSSGFHRTHMDSSSHPHSPRFGAFPFPLVRGVHAYVCHMPTGGH